MTMEDKVLLTYSLPHYRCLSTSAPIREATVARTSCCEENRYGGAYPGLLDRLVFREAVRRVEGALRRHLRH